MREVSQRCPQVCTVCDTPLPHPRTARHSRTRSRGSGSLPVPRRGQLRECSGACSVLRPVNARAQRRQSNSSVLVWRLPRGSVMSGSSAWSMPAVATKCPLDPAHRRAACTSSGSPPGASRPSCVRRAPANDVLRAALVRCFQRACSPTNARPRASDAVGSSGRRSRALDRAPRVWCSASSTPGARERR
jgi:hypothetical protein